ncbi:MAG: PEP-CTERM sorting domain-containing protein [Candidatus Auribacterota bacterium]|jgi:hypothetical protein|nr:PEP-CTERM sorting domain-containing protein [Candidatus Auribacterota bacterium]
MKKDFWYCLTVVLSICTSLYGFQVDGDLADWGVTPGSNLQPNPGINSWIEDFVDYNNQGYVGPAYGGQPYDVEALYVTIEGGNIFFAMVLGMPPEGSYPVPRINNDYYYPGDLGLDLNGDGHFEYGIEFTGHSDNSPGGAPGNNSYTYDPTKIGNVYEITNTQGWNKGLSISDYAPTEINYRKPQYLNLIGNTTVVYVQSSEPEHYVVETSIPLSWLQYDIGINWVFHWTMTCSNDIGEVMMIYTPYTPPTTTVPEPASLVLIGIAIVGIYIRKTKITVK